MEGMEQLGGVGELGDVEIILYNFGLVAEIQWCLGSVLLGASCSKQALK